MLKIYKYDKVTESGIVRPGLLPPAAAEMKSFSSFFASKEEHVAIMIFTTQDSRPGIHSIKGKGEEFSC